MFVDPEAVQIVAGRAPLLHAVGLDACAHMMHVNSTVLDVVALAKRLRKGAERMWKSMSTTLWRPPWFISEVLRRRQQDNLMNLRYDPLAIAVFLKPDLS